MPIPSSSWIFQEGDINNILGKLLTIVDSIGLEAEQKSAIKSLVKQAVWDEVEKPYRIWITPEFEELAWKDQDERRKGQVTPAIKATLPKKSK